MGASYRFTCACGYETDVSGGEDVGFLVRICTMACSDCKTLVDVVVGASMPDMPLEDDLKDLVGKCPDCKGTNVVRWPESHLCPKCNNPMKDMGVIMLWD